MTLKRPFCSRVSAALILASLLTLPVAGAVHAAGPNAGPMVQQMTSPSQASALARKVSTDMADSQKTYIDIQSPEFTEAAKLLEKVSNGEMSFEETGLPMPPEGNDSTGPAREYYLRIKTAKLQYDRAISRKESAARDAADAAQRAKEAAEMEAEVEAAQAEAADYAAQAEAEAAKAVAEAEKMMEEMRKKYNLPD